MSKRVLHHLPQILLGGFLIILIALTVTGFDLSTKATSAEATVSESSRSPEINIDDLKPSSPENEEIMLFQSDIELNKEGVLTVKESIHVYFPNPKHGLYRYIPLHAPEKEWWMLSPNAHIAQVKYYPAEDPEHSQDHYQTKKENDNLVIQIGEEDVTLSGHYIYEITYEYENTLLFHEDFVELYFNVTGNDWSMPLQQVAATITLPGEIEKSTCYTGYLSEEKSDCFFISDGDDKTTQLFTTKPLLQGEGITFNLLFDKSSVNDSTTYQKILTIIGLSGFLTFIPIVLTAFLIWWRWGKDPRPDTIIPQYEVPADIPPALAGFIVKQSAKNKFLSAELVYLATQGYLKIKQLGKKKYKFIRTQKADSGITEYQKILLQGLFKKGNSVTSSSLKGSFHQTANKVKKQVKKTGLAQKVLSRFSESLKAIMIALVVIILLVMGGALALLINLSPLWIPWPIGIGAGMLLGAAFIPVMSKRTPSGNKLYTHLMGVREYIDTAEKHRIEFHNDPEKAIDRFEELLPYAMIFGLEKKWAREFKDLYVEPPDWYQGNFSTFDAYLLSRSLGNLTSAVSAASIPPTQKSSFGGGSGVGGGFSGGGFGGGGGGSW